MTDFIKRLTTGVDENKPYPTTELVKKTIPISRQNKFLLAMEPVTRTETNQPDRTSKNHLSTELVKTKPVNHIKLKFKFFSVQSIV